MPSYLTFCYGGLESPGSKATTDGALLAQQCLERLSTVDREHFPPQLLILFTSPAYIEQPKASQLIAGIHQTFAESSLKIPLIGSSTAAVFFDGKVRENGALLVCLASRLLTPIVAVVPHACRDVESSVKTVLRHIGFDPTGREDPNPLANRMILSFFPGSAESTNPQGYSAEELYRLLWQGVFFRLPIVGGVSSANDPGRSKPSLQFAGRLVYSGALVAARLESGVPLGPTHRRSLTPTRQFVCARDVSRDRRTIDAFREGDIASGTLCADGPVLLGTTHDGADVVVGVPDLHDPQRPVQLLRDVSPDAPLQLLRADPANLSQTPVKALKDTMRRIRIENPSGFLGLVCTSYYRYREQLELDISALVTGVTSEYGCPYVGGFFDGEAGTDETGRSTLGNWGIAGIVCGDEMRDRAPLQRALAAIASNGVPLSAARSLNQAIKASLQLIYDTGYPGAMISLVLRDQAGDYIVAQDAIGERFKTIVALTRRVLTADDILAIAARERAVPYYFIADSRSDSRCDSVAVEISGLVSQYIIIIRDPKGETIATLQIDLGDARYKTRLHATEEEVLASLAAAVGASLNHAFSWEELQIARSFDQALAAAMACDSLESGLDRLIRDATAALNVEYGHIRLAVPSQHSLTLVAGTGPYYDAASKRRREVDISDSSPTATTFTGKFVIVVNDVALDEANKLLRQRFAAQEDLLSALQGVRSYANVPLVDVKETAIGVLSVASTAAWYFTTSHRRSLIDLGRRTSFLVEHLTRKEAERFARADLRVARDRVRFLLDSGPRAARRTIQNDPLQALKDTLNRFRSASHAELASLYLWNKDTAQFVLAASDGWADPTWIGAARYAEREGWTGTAALDERPRYVPDLRKHKRLTSDKPSAKYEHQMFGVSVGDLPVQAISLPLRFANTRLGVLTLHRRGVAPSFVTDDVDTLQEAGDDFAAVVYSVLEGQRAAWERNQQRLRNKLLEAVVAQDGSKGPEQIACQQLLMTFDATESTIFTVQNGELQWAASSNAAERTEHRAVPDALVKSAAQSRKIALQRREVAEADKWDPVCSASEGALERACIPLLVENRLYGVLDVHWSRLRRRLITVAGEHSPEQLELLSFRLASVFRRKQLALEREEAQRKADRGDVAVQAMGAMLFQSGHRLLNLLKSIREMPKNLRDAGDPKILEERIQLLDRLIARGHAAVERPMDVGRRMTSIDLQRCPLDDLLQRTLRLADMDRGLGAIETLLLVPDSIEVLVDPVLIVEAFLNIIDNAVRAMPNGGALSIRATLRPDAPLAGIVFADSGTGMTPEEVLAAQQGFAGSRHEGGTGVGLLIAGTLIHTQGGTLKVDSVKGSGTSVTVDVPLALSGS